MVCSFLVGTRKVSEKLFLRLPVTGAGAAKLVLDTDDMLLMKVEGDIIQALSHALNEPVVENGKPPTRGFDAEIPDETQESARKAMFKFLSKRYCRVQHIF